MANFKPVKIIKRGKCYQLYYYNPRGERRRLSIGTDYQQTQRLAVKFNDWLMEGKDPEQEIKKAQQEENRKAITIREFFLIFMKRHGNTRRPKTQKSYRNSFKNISRCPSLVDAEIGSISKGLVLDYMNARKDEGVTNASINREKAFLSCMLSCAVEWDVLDFNPLHGLKSFKESEKRDVEISEDQIAALMDVIPEPVFNTIEFACYTGFRLENILSLRIEEIRFHDLMPTAEVYREVKGGRKILFPLGERAVEVLKCAIGNRKEGYVFINPKSGTRYKSIQTSFNKGVQKLGLTALDGSKLRFHDLRHIFSNWLHCNGEGASLDQLRTLLGHKDRSTTDRYVTINRTVVGNILSILPDIRKTRQKNSSTSSEAEVI